ncbi:enoyl-CoA hydratase/isomerase like protein [Zymoseptoria brevis]|uniref:Enoyl-CoA hydratase/isomerase like protein n=1 Tax=Zymoseptoria brevis TaxID=1047168 RepID=A0A0F4GN76_9PEZI|nr:enoyl-CoA hydratase/isomerase like protein [Zymoseptoria brevis]
MAFKYIPPAELQEIPIPKNYSDLNFTQIRVTNVPESSKEVTPIQLVTLYRPQKVNAFTPKMMEELELAYTLFDIDDRVKCIVQTGSGKMFCAGADLETGFVGAQEAVRDHRDGGGRVTMAINRCRKPSIGALNGSAVGIGITMTLPMNIRIAYENAKIGFVFARRGLVMEAASSFFLPRLIGTSKALHLCTTGATYPAKHPLLNTLFSETLPTPEAVLPRALEIADEVVKNCSGISTYLMKEMMYRNPDTAEGAHLLDSRIVYELFSSKDNKEGVQAFLQKRPVNFVGTMQNDAPAAYPWWDPVSTANRPVAKGYAFKPNL